jgi:hypothetical protein
MIYEGIEYAIRAGLGRNEWVLRSRFLTTSEVNPRLSGAADSLLVACGSKTVAKAVQPPLADRACSGAGRVRVEIDSISADFARSVAVAVLVSVYTLVAERACRPAVAVTISVLVLPANPAGSIAVSISVGVHAATVLGAGRVARSIRVKAALGVQGMNEYGQHQGCKNETQHKNISLRCLMR